MKYIVMILIAMAASSASAGTLVCSNSKVKTVAYHGNNRLMVQLENMNVPVFFCNPDAEWSVSGTTYVMGPETCKAVFSIFLSAKASGKPVTRIHFDGDDVPETCDGWESWKSASIRYVNY